MDLNAIKAKLRGLEEGKPKTKKWKPKDTHTARLLPLPGDEDLCLIIKWHYSVDNGRQMYCPATHGDECPFCNFAQSLKGWKYPNGKDKPEAQRKLDWEWFKKIDAAVKHYAPVIVRKGDGKTDEFEGPFLWEMTPKTYTALFKICANDDWNEEHPQGGGLKVLTSLEHGLDVVVQLKKKGEKGNTTSFDLTDVEERKKFSPVLKDKAVAATLMEKIPDISEIGKPISTAEAEAIFRTWEQSFSPNAEPSSASGVEHGGENATNSAETIATGGASVDDVVSKLTSMLTK